MKRQQTKTNRRDFLKISGMTGLGLMSVPGLNAFAAPLPLLPTTNQSLLNMTADEKDISLIGPYGKWAASLTEGKFPSHSFRRKEFTNIEVWRKQARGKLIDRMAIPNMGAIPKITVKNKSNYDGLSIEEISWQLPYGHPTEATVLKPQNSSGKLPGILAFHDHGGNKYFGKQKITKISDTQHPLMGPHQTEYYSGFAWANEIAKRGYVVIVPDAFPFESRRVLLGEVPEHLRNGLTDVDHDKPENIERYNRWAGEHEHVMAKSLFSAGTTWPAVYFAEDQMALNVLCARPDVDTSNIGCGGLSGGGMRTVYMGGIDPRIKCAVCVGFMTTWKDFVLSKSYTHTWMAYVPLLPNELDFPEILSLRAPLPTMVLNDSEDQLYTLPEMQRADSMLSEIFKKANATEKYKCSYYPGPHKFDSKMQAEAFDWFDRWLKKK
jgi:dienelactone hydrolase